MCAVRQASASRPEPYPDYLGRVRSRIRVWAEARVSGVGRDTRPRLGVGWNDRITSFKSYENCATKLWENTFSGSSYGFCVNSTYVGAAMNDRASSMQFN